MVRNSLAIAALLLATAGAAQAQAPTFGVIGGITSSKVTVDGEGISLTLDSRTGFAGGVTARFPLSSMLGLEVDAMYAQKGFKISDGGDSAELKLGYIEVPVLLAYEIGTASARPFLLAGGTASIKAGCDVGATSGGVSASSSCEDVVESEQKSLDLGLTFGGGVAFNRFSVQARYTVGMTEIFDDEDETVTSKNRALFLLAGFSF